MTSERLPPSAPPPPTPWWGAQTESALRHFDVGSARMPQELIRALLIVKAAAARANAQLGVIDPAWAEAIADVANELLRGDARRLRAAFPLSPWQSGSGTQTNMNANEVLARLAQARLGPPARVHPNDDVNRGQSSNDVMPAALHVAAARAVRQNLLPALDALVATLARLSARYARLVKLGRTHLQDAVPLTFGQELGAWQSQVQFAREGIAAALPGVLALPLGGTAVGTGLNAHARFAETVCRELAFATGLPFEAAANRFALIAGQEAVVTLHGTIKTAALALHKLANDLRLLASGPHGGLAEVRLPANEAGSSIMPGKVNPTQCEMLSMVSCQVMANDLAVTLGAAGGQLQLNTCRPLIAVNLLQSIELLSDASRSFERHALRGLEPDEARMGALLDASLMSATALAPHIGYDLAARIVGAARREGLPLREAARAHGVDPVDFDRWTDPAGMLGPR